MQVVQMGCCAFNEIRGLSQHRTPATAMKEFCRQALGTPFGRTKPGAFYLFTAVIASKAGDGLVGTYGDRFAAFIKKNKLGAVIPTMDRFNRRNVPGHLIRGWVWAPSEKAIREWWKKNRGKNG